MGLRLGRAGSGAAPGYPTLRFKLDPTSSWDEQLIAELDQPADPVLYRRVVEAFADAWIEDPSSPPRPTSC